MKREKRWVEPVKTLLIVLLSASALLLIYLSGVFSILLPERSLPSLIIPEAPAISYSAAVYPAEAAVIGQSGLCYGVKYDTGALEELFAKMSPQLGEALGSAEPPERIGEAEWLALLDEAGLYLNYGCAVPLPALSAWLGVEPQGTQRIRALILSEGEQGSVRLCYRDEEGNACSCRTAGLWSSLSRQLEAYRPNGAFFARHWPSLADCNAEMLVLETLPVFHTVSVSSGQTAAASVLAEKTGIRLNSVSRYSEPDGTVVYPGENGVLRLHADGRLSFLAGGDFALAEGDSMQELLERSRLLTEELHSAFAGDERLYCVDCVTDELLSGEIGFDYVCESLLVLRSSGNAVRLRWTNGKLTELTLTARCYRVTETAVELLPEKQAAAAAGSREPGSEAGLRLYDSGKNRMTPFWSVLPKPGRQEREETWKSAD